MIILQPESNENIPQAICSPYPSAWIHEGQGGGTLQSAAPMPQGGHGMPTAWLCAVTPNFGH